MDVNYLDAQVIVSEGKSIIDLYVKQTDIHQCLHTPSCHPYHRPNQYLTVKH